MHSGTAADFLAVLNSVDVKSNEIVLLLDAARALAFEAHGGEPLLYLISRRYAGRLRRGVALLHRFEAYDTLRRQGTRGVGGGHLLDLAPGSWRDAVCGAVARSPLMLLDRAIAFDPHQFMQTLKSLPATQVA